MLHVGFGRFFFLNGFVDDWQLSSRTSQFQWDLIISIAEAQRALFVGLLKGKPKRKPTTESKCFCWSKLAGRHFCGELLPVRPRFLENFDDVLAVNERAARLI